MDTLLVLLVQLIIVGMVFYVLWWLLGKIALPAPFDKIAIVVLALICVIYLLNLLIGMPRIGIGKL